MASFTRFAPELDAHPGPGPGPGAVAHGERAHCRVGSPAGSVRRGNGVTRGAAARSWHSHAYVGRRQAQGRTTKENMRALERQSTGQLFRTLAAAQLIRRVDRHRSILDRSALAAVQRDAGLEPPRRERQVKSSQTAVSTPFRNSGRWFRSIDAILCYVTWQTLYLASASVQLADKGRV